MRIFLAGGGTGGPIAPLLAVAETLQRMHPKVQFFYIGTQDKISQRLLETAPVSVKYLSIPAGKWRRYFSFQNFIDIFKIFAGFLKSLVLVSRYKPDLVLGAGSYVQVPLAYAAYLKGVPVVVHQQDFTPLLSTRLVAPVATAITTSFSYSEKNIPYSSGLFAKSRQKIFVTGNPVREELLQGNKAEAVHIFGINQNFPVVLVLGGGTGALPINEVVLKSLPEVSKYVQIIHVTGGKDLPAVPQNPHYHVYDFLGEELKHAYAAADLVVSRGGMSTITEIARLGKPAILIPLPESAQESNVHFLTRFNMAVGIPESVLTPKLFVEAIRKILWSQELQQQLRENIKRLMPRDSALRIAKLILKTYNNRRA